MSHCEFQPRLSAWYDGELAADEAWLVERHVEAGCPVCRADLAAMRTLTAGVGAATRLANLAESVDDLHAVIRREAGPAPAQSDLRRTAVVLSGLAASILVVSATWLAELRPGPTPGGQVLTPSAVDAGGPALALSSDWETVATTLRADPRPELLADSPLEPRYADAIDWLLQNLAPAGGRDSSEGQTWVKPGS